MTHRHRATLSTGTPPTARVRDLIRNLAGSSDAFCKKNPTLRLGFAGQCYPPSYLSFGVYACLYLMPGNLTQGESNAPSANRVQAKWQTVRNSLLVKEKEATRALGALAAERRRLPAVRAAEQLLAGVCAVSAG
jgi:Bacterial protein of unknown function (DUF899)